MTIEVAPKTPRTADQYAIFANGGKQYQAIQGKTVAVELINAEPGTALTFSEVLFRKTGVDTFEVGQPFLKTPIKASVVKHMREPKVIIFKFKRRKKVRVKKGHRQHKTIIRIESI